MFRTIHRSIVYTRIKTGNEITAYVNSLKCLGTVLDPYPNFDEHIDTKHLE